MYVNTCIKYEYVYTVNERTKAKRDIAETIQCAAGRTPSQEEGSKRRQKDYSGGSLAQRIHEKSYEVLKARKEKFERLQRRKWQER